MRPIKSVLKRGIYKASDNKTPFGNSANGGRGPGGARGGGDGSHGEKGQSSSNEKLQQQERVQVVPTTLSRKLWVFLEL
jgi:hypothetical protein